MTSLFYPPKFASELAGSKLTFTQTGTTTPQNTYQNEALSTPHANPVVADAAGVFGAIYLDPTLPSYRVRWTTAADVLIYQSDGVPSNQNTSTGQRIESTAPQILLYDTDGTSNQRKFAIRVIGNQLNIGAWNDAENSFTSFMRIEGGVVQRLVLDSGTYVDDGVTEVPLPYPVSGTFTGTLTGYASGPTGTVSYKVMSGIVTLWVVLDVTGTSNANTLTMTGLPTVVRPGSIRAVPCQLMDNTQDCMAGLAIIETGGSITFRIARQDAQANLIQYTAAGFTTSGTKGIPSHWMVQYVKTS